MVRAIGEAAWTALCSRADPLDDALLVRLSPMIILAPHADDETLGCGGLLAAASDRGLRPHVVYLTDGSASHGGSIAWPPGRLAQIRREEALAALRELGVPQSQVLFMDWTDGSPLTPFGPEYEASVGRLLRWLEAVGPQSLWAPRPGESHCDHEAAAELAEDLCLRRMKGLRRFDYLVWGWKDDRLTQLLNGERGWRLSCEGRTDQRRRALFSHRTQTTRLIDDAEEGFLIPAELAALVDRPQEIFIERS